AIGLMLVAGAAGAVLGFCLLRVLDGLPRAIATGSAARPAD
ncbi:MFS transporter, partial [Pseudomonas aeruginosa]|nr:MFS transporter [Pseudomonas aeruginosa]